MVLSFIGGRFGGPPRPPATHSAAQIVRAYWEGLRGDAGGLPERADLDPRGLGAALTHVFIAERIGTGLLRLRIAGAGLTDLSGLEMHGLPLSTLFLPEARPRLAQSVEAVFARPAAAELDLEAERTIGRPALSARLILLPLQPGEGGVPLLLGCLSPSGDLGRAPRRFAISRAVEERLVTAAPPVPARSGFLPPGLPQPDARHRFSPPSGLPQGFPPQGTDIASGRPRAFAEDPAPAPAAGPGKRAHLRLVHSAD